MRSYTARTSTRGNRQLYGKFCHRRLHRLFYMFCAGTCEIYNFQINMFNKNKLFLDVRLKFKYSKAPLSDKPQLLGFGLRKFPIDFLHQPYIQSQLSFQVWCNTYKCYIHIVGWREWMCSAIRVEEEKC